MYTFSQHWVLFARFLGLIYKIIAFSQQYYGVYLQHYGVCLTLVPRKHTGPRVLLSSSGATLVALLSSSGVTLVLWVLVYMLGESMTCALV